MNEATGKRSIAKSAFVLVIVSFLLSTTVSILSLHMMSQNNVREMNKVLATQVYEYISGELSGPIMAARTMSSNSFLVDALRNEEQLGEDAFSTAMVDYLSGIEDGLGYQASFVVSDATQRYYTRYGYNRTIHSAEGEQDEWYTEFVNSDALYDLNVDSDEKNKADLTVYVNVKVKDRDKSLLGVCGLGVRMTGMQELFLGFEEGFGVKINLVDSQGIVQVDTNSDNIETVDLSGMIDGKTSGEYVYEDLSGDRFLVTKYVDDLDWYLVVQSNGLNNTRQFANIVALNVVLCLIVLVILFVALRINQRRTNELTSASIKDHLTGLYNKRAFEHDKAALLAQPLDEDFACVTIDVNGLKTVNDTLGHAAGDELIEGAADCMRICFKPFGKVYRIGGDEFAAFLHVPEDELDDLGRKLNAVVSGWSGELVGSLSLSCGIASTREFPDEDISILNEISDRRMYEDKDRHYERTGKKKRQT